ncbi:MAG TPA: cupin domain-containing protein [Candidatus Binataceae bacterium]|nr:cupin domain-containing protein [Candidatus Binataceae bacterium]
MARQVRRIVTGHNAQGRSIIVADEKLPAHPAADAPLRVGLWLTDRAPASNRGNENPVPDGVIDKTPPQHRGGSVFRIVEFPPDKGRRPQSPEEMMKRDMEVTPERTARHPGFHRTNTVDYALCLEGEIWALLDEGETLMCAGDVMIQRGTYHAWSNRSERPAVVAFVLIDADPA